MSAQAAATSQGIASLGQLWLLGAEQMGLPSAGEAIGLDLVVAALPVFLPAPLLVAIALLIRFPSEGPVLFRQTHGGLHGCPFEIDKFRTMTVQENGTAVVEARRGDPRVTPLGRFLRSSSLDELLLFNVLEGDMSMIGPQPHGVDRERDFALRVADYALRHHVGPGITGWARVCGYRGETRTEDALARRIALDLHYIER